MWAVRAALVSLLIVIIIAFGYSNMGDLQTVDVNLEPFFPDRTGVPLVTIILWAFAAGVTVSLLLFILTYIKLSLQLHSMKKRNKSLEGEVSILRNRPIEESANLLQGVDSRRQKDELSLSSVDEVKSDA